MKFIVLFVFVMFILGYFSVNLFDRAFIQSAQAAVAGMGRYDLMRDYDFKDAVKAVIQNDCSVTSDGVIRCW